MNDSNPRSRKPSNDKQALAGMLEQKPPPLSKPPQLLEKKTQPCAALDDIELGRRRPRAALRPPPMPLARDGVLSDDGPMPPIVSALATAKAELHRNLLASGAFSAPRSLPALPRGAPMAERRPPWKVVLVALISIVVLLWLTQPPQTHIHSGFRFPGFSQDTPPGNNQNYNTPAGEHSLIGPSSVTPQQVEQVLAEYRSPAVGTGALWVELGRRYNIDPAYALAFFIHESSAGTNPAWAGLKPDGSTTHNVGNIICAGYATCFGRFRDYPNWQAGIEDWYRLIAHEYIQGRNIHTLEQIIPIYAPSIENNVPGYIQTVAKLVESWQH